MNLLKRFVVFCIISTFRLSFWLIVQLIHFLMPVFLATSRIMGRVLFTSLTATVHGPRKFADRLASEWTRRLLEMGIPRENIDQAYALCHLLVFSVITLGWLISALFTVAVVRVVFGFFI